MRERKFRVRAPGPLHRWEIDSQRSGWLTLVSGLGSIPTTCQMNGLGQCPQVWQGSPEHRNPFVSLIGTHTLWPCPGQRASLPGGPECTAFTDSRSSLGGLSGSLQWRRAGSQEAFVCPLVEETCWGSQGSTSLDGILFPPW